MSSALGTAAPADVLATSSFAFEGSAALSAYRSALERGTSRKEALAVLLDEGREQIRAAFSGTPNSGIEAGQALSELQDFVLRELFIHASEAYPLIHPTRSERLSVVAVGGYGRGLMAPGSDVDLLFVTPYKRTAWTEQMVEVILYALWDLKLKVGQATRSIDECIRLAGDDMTIRTSLLETRFLGGDEDLYDEMRGRLWKDLFSSTATEFATSKLAERSSRHSRVGNSRYLLEPNIKEGKGALRDLHSLFWIAKYIYGVESVEELVAKEVFTLDEAASFDEAERFFWTVRFWLHYLSGRANEQIGFERQIEIAEAMGFEDDAAQMGVERFMRQYFTHAKEVGDLTRIFCAALEAQHLAPKRRAGNGFMRLLGFGQDQPISVEHGRILIQDTEYFRDAPIEMLRVFLNAAKSDTTIHPTTLRLVRQNLELLDGLREDADANAVFLEILCETKAPEKALRLMNEAGVLGAFMPEFGEIVCMMQFNMYHHYTVDEHTIRAIGELARIIGGKIEDETPLATALMRGRLNRRILFVALLLHDIGKGRREDHSILGAKIAETVCPRLGLTEGETERVVWLVRWHLYMSDVAQKRDLSDQQTIRDFGDQVQSLESLSMLLVLTVCDIRAVGPGTWNGWKAQLLRTLFYETRGMLSGGHHGMSESRRIRVETAKDALRERLKDMDEDAQERLISPHYDPYWLGLAGETHEVHARMLARQKDDALLIDVSGDAERAATRISMAMGDHPGLFARITGACALAGASIVEAHTFTTRDGLALAALWIQDADGEAYDDASRLKRLRHSLTEVLSGAVQPHIAFVEREKQRLSTQEKSFQVAPHVVFDNSASELFTVIEVTGRDRLGLLHDLSRSITNQRVSIFSTVIATYGERVSDSFYVKDMFGHKITSESRQKSIADALYAALREE